MSHEVLISARDGVARIAQIEAGQLVGFQAARMGQEDNAAEQLVGHIYLAQVERVVPASASRFCEYRSRARRVSRRTRGSGTGPGR